MKSDEVTQADLNDSVFGQIFKRLENFDATNSDRDETIKKLTLEVHDLAVAVNKMRSELNALVQTLRGLGATASLMGNHSG